MATRRSAQAVSSSAQDKERATPRASQTVAEARALAQRAKLNAKPQAVRTQPAQKGKNTNKAHGKDELTSMLAKRRAATTIEHAMTDFIDDHEGGNHSPKTVEWHCTALGLFRAFLE
jgi:hypothetical protein